jgi:hypothetical protein
MITPWVCGPMLTSVAFGPENILLGFDSLVLSGPDIRSEFSEGMTQRPELAGNDSPVLEDESSAPHELRTNFFLKVSELAAKRRLRGVQFRLCRQGQALGFGDRNEIAQVS